MTRSATRTNIRLLTLPVLVVVVLVLTAVAASTHQAVHEAWHGNLYRSLRAHNLVGTVLVTPLGLNYAQQRVKHRHHGFVGTGRDPIQYKGKPDTRVAYLLLVLVAPFLFAMSLWAESLLLLLGVFRPGYLSCPALHNACRRNAVVLLGWSAVS